MSLLLEFDLNYTNVDLSIAYKDLSGKMTLKGKDDSCFPELHGRFEIDTRDYKGKLFNYSSFVIATAILILFSAVITYNGLVQNQYDCQQYSLTSLVFVMIQDMFVTFLMIYLGLLNQTVFHLYFTPALWYFIIFSILDFRLLMLLWKLQNQRSLSQLTQTQLRKRTFLFHARIYALIGAGVVVMRYLVTSRYLVPIVGLVSAPQIYQIAKKQINHKLDYYFSVIFLHARIFILVG